MSDEIVIPPANSSGLITRTHGDHHSYRDHDFAHTSERVIESAHQAERYLETNSRNFECRTLESFAVTQKQIADFRCEIKDLVRDESRQTRDLINANTVQSLRDALAAAQRFIPLTVPVPL